MGIDVWALDFLFRLRGRPFGKTLFIGRQGIYLPDTLRSMARDVVATNDPMVTLDQLLGSSGYAEDLFHYFGSTSVESLDATDYEGAEFIYDLNKLIPDEMKDRFDTVYDGGTLEHIFNFPVAIQNVKDMVRVGGRVIMVTPANNWLGHGLYQFSPELLYGVFSRDFGFEIEMMNFVEINSYPAPRPAEDPRAAGRRIEIQCTAMPTYLCVAARKLRQATPAAFTQSDYVDLWKANNATRSKAWDFTVSS